MTKLNVLKRALASAHLPGDIKLFFFGLYRKDSEKKNARHEGTGAGFIPRSYKNQMTKTRIRKTTPKTLLSRHLQTSSGLTSTL